jgi:hypothetical protein
MLSKPSASSPSAQRSDRGMRKLRQGGEGQTRKPARAPAPVAPPNFTIHYRQAHSMTETRFCFRYPILLWVLGLSLAWFGAWRLLA